MLKILIKKQIKELGYMYFKGRKNNSFDKKSVLPRALLFAFLYLSLSISFFGISTSLIEPMVSAKMNWLYFAMMASFGLSLSVFSNMFFAYANLFMAKDNDLMLSLPIKSEDVVLSKFIANFINCLVYVSMVFIPAIIKYCLYCKEYKVIILGLVVLVLISLVSLIIANIIGFIISKISKYFKNRAYITFILTLLFLVVYYYLTFNLSKFMENIVSKLDNIELIYKTYFGLFYYFATGVLGNYINLLIACVIVILLFVLCFIVIKNQYLKVATTSAKDKKREYNNSVSKSNSIFVALLKREFKHLIANATYLLNCGMASIILIGVGVLSFIYKAKIHLTILEMNAIFGSIEEYIPLVIIAGLLFILSVSYASTPAVSLEGNNYWIVRSLPVDSDMVLNAKRYMEFLLNVIPTVFALMCISLNVKIQVEALPILIVLAVVICHATSYFHLTMGVLTARLDWTNEAVVVKQSLGCMIDIFAGWLFIALLGFIYYLLMNKITVLQYLYGLLILFILVSKLLQNWLKKKGTQLFERL